MLLVWVKATLETACGTEAIATTFEAGGRAVPPTLALSVISYLPIGTTAPEVSFRFQLYSIGPEDNWVPVTARTTVPLSAFLTSTFQVASAGIIAFTLTELIAAAFNKVGVTFRFLISGTSNAVTRTLTSVRYG